MMCAGHGTAMVAARVMCSTALCPYHLCRETLISTQSSRRGCSGESLSKEV